MATFTAQILVGHAHQNHGGIIPTHTAFLSENSRPAWTLMPVRFPDARTGSEPDPIVWIPTVEHMLEDALLMIAVHALREPGIVAQLRAAVKNKNIDRLELYEGLPSADREALYQQCRALAYPLTMALTALHGSTIRHQLSVLETYSMDVDVCLPVYSRHYSAWSQQVQTTGSLG